jgi:ATP-binding cassette subfamily F protein 3
VIAWQRPNLLLLDEPTNHLDLEMRQALTMALQNFDGAIVVVSHDRHLLRNTVDEFWLVNDGRVVEYQGDLEDYERWLADRRKDDTEAPKRQSVAAEGGQDAAVNGESADDRKVRKRAEAAVRQKISPFRKQQATLEKQMDSMQAALAEMDAELTNPALYSDSGKQQLKTLLGRQAEARQKMAAVETQWLDVSETVEALEAELES